MHAEALYQSIPQPLFLVVEQIERTGLPNPRQQFAIISEIEKIVAAHCQEKGSSYTRDLESRLRPVFAYIESMTCVFPALSNFMLNFQTEILQLPTNMPESEARKTLLLYISSYVRYKLVLARNEVLKNTAAILHSGDHVLAVYSDLIFDALELAAQNGKILTIHIVCSGNPSAARFAETMHSLGSTVCFIAPESAVHFLSAHTKTFLECFRVYQNAFAYSAAGSLSTAASALAFNSSVYMLAETAKIYPQDASLLRNSSETFSRTVTEKNSPAYCRDILTSENVSKIITELGLFPFAYVSQLAKGHQSSPMKQMLSYKASLPPHG